MCKEMWIANYECQVENIAIEFDIEFEEAESRLNDTLKNDPSYLDDYSNLYMGRCE
jgi:hypothetical protein